LIEVTRLVDAGSYWTSILRTNMAMEEKIPDGSDK